MAYILRRSRSIHGDECYVQGGRSSENYDFDDDEEYVERMRRILFGYPHLGCPPEPSLIAPCVYLGCSSNAENHALLKKYRITHVLDCSGRAVKFTSRFHKNSAYPPHVGVKKVLNLEGEDNRTFNILEVLSDAFAFITSGVRSGGRVLVYCSGVSLSGAVCIAYLMHTRIPLLAATKEIKDARRTTLGNTRFMRQLVSFARSRGMLDKYPDAFPLPEYGGPMDRRRLMFAHFPLDMF